MLVVDIDLLLLLLDYCHCCCVPTPYSRVIIFVDAHEQNITLKIMHVRTPLHYVGTVAADFLRERTRRRTIIIGEAVEQEINSRRIRPIVVLQQLQLPRSGVFIFGVCVRWLNKNNIILNRYSEDFSQKYYVITDIKRIKRV